MCIRDRTIIAWFTSPRGVYPSLPCLEQAALLQDHTWSTWHICSNIKYFPKLFAGLMIIPFHIYFAWLKLTIWTAEIVLYETFRICLIWQSYYCLIHFTKRCVSQPAMPIRASSTSAGSYMVHLTNLFLYKILSKVVCWIFDYSFSYILCLAEVDNLNCWDSPLWNTQNLSNMTKLILLDSHHQEVCIPACHA